MTIHDDQSVMLEIDKLVPWNKNPRHNDEAVDAVALSIQEFGWTNPILARSEDMMVIAGHTRLKAAKKLGFEVVPVRFLDVSEKDAQRIAIADNKIGEIAVWNDDLLAEILNSFDVQELSVLGFDENELMDFEIDSELQEEILPQVKFSEFIDEANNYIVLLFNGEMDWIAAQTHFNLSTKSSRRQNGKEWSKGIGRVIDGAKYLTEISQSTLFTGDE